MRCELIAELCTNWGGDLDLACDLIRQCAEAGADTAKFQSFQTTHLSPDDPQYDWLKQAELSDDAHVRLLNCCREHSVRFLTTIFHEDRALFLKSLGLTHIKIGSGEAMRRSLIDEVARYPWHVYLSTGLATLNEIAYAVKVLGKRLTLMHAVSEYPTPMNRANLPRIAWLKEKFGVSVGYSDHTIGHEAAMVAMSCGAVIVEKHYSTPDCPRRSKWDTDTYGLRWLDDWRKMIAQAHTLRPMCQAATGRPFVGRWSHNE